MPAFLHSLRREVGKGLLIPKGIVAVENEEVVSGRGKSAGNQDITRVGCSAMPTRGPRERTSEGDAKRGRRPDDAAET